MIKRGVTFTRLGLTHIGLLLASHANSAAVDYGILLRAIAQVETGTTDISKPCKKVGKAGERSAWQMKRIVWEKYTTEPFTKASTDADLGRIVAIIHMQELGNNFYGFGSKPYSIALYWNAGLKAHHYAERVERLYGALLLER